MIDPIEIAKWREAHQGIYVPEEGLATVAPFPSLYATDFAVYLQAKGVDRQIVGFIVDLTREVAWVYDNWAKAQHDADPGRLLDDLLTNASKEDSHYGPLRQFVRDYAGANGVRLRSTFSEKPAWQIPMDQLTEVAAPAPVADPIEAPVEVPVEAPVEVSVDADR